MQGYKIIERKSIRRERNGKPFDYDVETVKAIHEKSKEIGYFQRVWAYPNPENKAELKLGDWHSIDKWSYDLEV